MKIIKLAIIATALLGLSACHSELDNQPDGKVNTAKQITFKVNFEDYNADKEVQGTRALVPDTISKQVIDLDNNLMAEVSIQRDTTRADRATTRALTDGTYTLLAYQGSTLVDEVTGTVNSGVFTISSGSMNLEPGTYDFVLYSDLTRSGNTFIVDRSNMSNALIGRTTGVVLTAQDATKEVVFNLKHLGARMKIKLTGYMPYPAMAATLASINATSVPNQATYDVNTDTWTGYTHAALSENCTFPANNTWAEGNTGGAVGTYQDLNYPSTNSDYFYFLPTTDASKLELTFHSGKIYRADFGNHNASLTLAPNPAVVMQNNGSYIINVKLRPNYLYLMSDGSTDFINATQYTRLRKSDGTPLYRDKQGNVLASPKVPVGLVVSQSRRLAAALKDIPEGAYFVCYTGPQAHPPGPQAHNLNYKYYGSRTLRADWPTESEVAAMIQDMDGYRYTWEASGSADGTTIKANQPTLYPAFYRAAHYREELQNSGVTLTGTMATANWYLPSAGEMYLFAVASGFSDGTYKNYWSGNNYKWASTAFYFELIDLGITPPAIYDFWTSTEYLPPVSQPFYRNDFCETLLCDGNMYFGTSHYQARIRPFVKY